MKTKKDLQFYQSIVDFLGHHPTTTELAKKKEWRNLWHRASRNWGCFDNFRKEYGIPIPSKGSSKFKELAKNRSKKTREEYKNRIMNLFAGQNDDALTCNKASILLGINGCMLKKCLLELLDEKKIYKKEISGHDYYSAHRFEPN